MVIGHLYIIITRDGIGYQRFIVHSIAIVMNVLETNGKTEINAVVDIAAQVEVIFSDIACLGTVEGVVLCIDSINVVVFVLNHTGCYVEVIDYILAITCIQVAMNGLDGGLAVLRRTIDGSVGC